MGIEAAVQQLPRQPGTYVLVLSAAAPGDVTVGRRGTLALQPGYYLYVGSARGPGGLRARVGRHLRGAGRPRWHVDHLRARAVPWAVWFALAGAGDEHRWAAALADAPTLSIPFPRFGSSDCRCPAHLFFSPSAPAAAGLLQDAVAPETLRQILVSTNAPPQR